MHNTVKCCKFDKDGKPKDRLAIPFNSAKKPWKKGGGDSGQVAYLAEEMNKLKQKLKKTRTKKHTKR